MTGAGPSSPVPRAEAADLSAFDIAHARPFQCELRIGHSDLSRSIAHVSNTEYVRWVDRAAELHADALGYTRPALLDRGIMWFVVRHEIDYLAEAWPDQHLLLATWVRTMDRVKSWRDTLIVRPVDQTIVCRAATLWVLVDLATRKPTRIDQEMARRFEPLHPPKAGQRCTSP